MSECRLSDGRVLSLCRIKPDLFKMKDGLITKRRCAKCREFKDIAGFPATGKKKNILYSYCDECRLEKWSELKYGKDRREHGFNGFEKIEHRIQMVGGVRHLECCLCRRLKDMSQFRPKKGARCHECHSKEGSNYGSWWFLKKRAKDMFGEESEQYKSIAEIGFKGDFRAVAEKYGFLHVKSSNAKHKWRTINRFLKNKRSNDERFQTLHG